MSPFRPSFLPPPVVHPANHRFFTPLFSASSESLFSQLLCFHIYLRCPIVFSNHVLHETSSSPKSFIYCIYAESPANSFIYRIYANTPGCRIPSLGGLQSVTSHGPRVTCHVCSIACRLPAAVWRASFSLLPPLSLFSIACALFCKNRGGMGRLLRPATFLFSRCARCLCGKSHLLRLLRGPGSCQSPLLLAQGIHRVGAGGSRCREQARQHRYERQQRQR